MTDRSDSARLALIRAAGWLIALGGPVVAAMVAAEVDQPTLWLGVLSAAVITVATRLSGALAGLVAAASGATATLVLLDGEVGAHGELAVAVGVGGASLALLVAAVHELRQRERLRIQWLDHLGRLSEDLADVVQADDAIAEVAAAALRASGAREVLVAGAANPSILPAGELPALDTPATVQGGDQHVDVSSSGTPPLVLRMLLPEPPPVSLALEHAAFLRAIADQCSTALERAALVQSEQQTKDDLELLARASAALSSSLDLERVGTTTHDLLVPYLADECTLEVIRPSRRTAPDPNDDGPGVTTIPLRDRGQVIGRMLLRRHGRPLTSVEHSAALLVAEPASRALAHALLFSEQVRTSATLEHSLLPEATLPVDDLQIATRYLAAAEGHAAGGDFYDVLRAPGGGAVLVVGDVQGKGVEAATLTSTARHTLRAAALAGARPRDMLEQLNRALLYGHAERLEATGEPTVRFVTASVVWIEPTGRGFRAVVASGGHPPPLLIRSGGGVEQLVAEGPLLGVFDDPFYEEHVRDLGLSDVLLMYTDGVTEQRQQPDLFDEAQLGRLVRNMLTARHADAVAQQILDTVVVLSPREVRDDIALVVARVVGPR